MLTKLSAANFKSWPTLGPTRLGPITGLFGTNSSGKTSVMQLLLMLKQTVESTDRATVLEFGGENSLANLGSFRDVVFRHQESEPLEFAINWERRELLKIMDPMSKGETLFSSKAMGFRARVQAVDGKKLTVSELSYEIDGKRFLMRRKRSKPKYELDCEETLFHFQRTVGRPWDLPAPVKCYGFPDQVYAYFQNAGFLAQLQLEFEETLKNVYYLGPLRNYPQRYYSWTGSEPADMGRHGERVVDAILASRARGRTISPGYRRNKKLLEERVAHWLKELGLVSEFKIEPIADGSKLYHVRVRKSPNSPDVLITDVGFGVSQVLPVLVICYYVPEGSTILLEQPEIHLHPSVQSGLADVFIDVMKNRNVQIILESHSEHLLRRLQRRIAEEKIEPRDTALYFCDATAGYSELIELDVDLLGGIHNWPKDFFGDEFNEMASMTEAAMKRKAAGRA